MTPGTRPPIGTLVLPLLLAAACGSEADPNPHDITLVEVTDTLDQLYYPAVAGATALVDIDNDGDLDMVLARKGNGIGYVVGGPPVLLRNEGYRGGFAALAPDAEFAALVESIPAVGVATGDFDGDGDADIFLGADGPDHLFENDGTGRFTDISEAAGIGGLALDRTRGAMWVDLNRDGLLDLYVLSHQLFFPPNSRRFASSANRLYLNRGDGTFAEVGTPSGTDNRGAAHAVIAADLDGDGDLELHIANDQYVKESATIVEYPDAALLPDAYLDLTGIDGDGVPHYADRTAEYGLDGVRAAMGIALADVNRDGFDDLYITDWGANHMFVWRPDAGVYEDVAAEWGVANEGLGGTSLVSWGTRFTDLDRDGYEELFVANGWLPVADQDCFDASQLDFVYRRAGEAARFDDVTAAVGFKDPAALSCPVDEVSGPVAGITMVFGDVDGDGDDDLVLGGIQEQYRLFRNDTPQDGRHRLRVRLIGTVSSPDPAGAILDVTLLDGRKVHRTLFAGGDLYSQGDRILEVGLGDDEAVTDATVRWPSGRVQRIDQESWFELDRELRIVEPQWLSLSARVAMPADTPVLTYVDADGRAGRAVVFERSDGLAVSVTDDGGGTYSAPLPHPGDARVTVVTISVDGTALRPRPTVNYKSDP